MSEKRGLRLLTLLAITLILALHGQSLWAATSVAVGPSTCQPGLVHFPTIQAAVNAVPWGATVLVCPGTYAEQVDISQPMTLKGVVAGTSGASVITVPAGGLTLNATAPTLFGGAVTAQISVHDTVGVTISDLLVDGTGTGCVAGANREAGIVFYNIGVPADGTAGGKVQNVVVRNEQGCEGGEGIVSDSSYITISSNEIHDVTRSSVITGGGYNNIASNNMQNTLNGVVVEFADTHTLVSSNTISAINPYGGFITQGIWVQSGGAIVSKNTVSTSGGFSYGINLASAVGANVQGNKVNGVNYGVILNNAHSNIVQTNTFSNDYLGIYDIYSLGGNTANKNVVNEGSYGVFEFLSNGDVLTPNSLFNVIVTVDPSEPDPGTNTAM